MNPLTLLLDVWVPAIVAGADKVPGPRRREGRLAGVRGVHRPGVAVAFLGFSLTRHLRKASDNAEHGCVRPQRRADEGRS